MKKNFEYFNNKAYIRCKAKLTAMKTKLLLTCCLSLVFSKTFAGNENLSEPNKPVESSMGGCFGAFLLYSCPNADSLDASSSHDTIYISGNDTVFFDIYLNGFEGCPGTPYLSDYYKDGILLVDSFPGNISYPVQQTGVYHGVGHYGSMYKVTGNITVINTSAPTSVGNNQISPTFNIMVEGDKINVNNFKETKGFTFSLYDLRGRVVYQKEFTKPSVSFEIELPKSVSGLYIINFRNEDFVYTKKVNF